MDFHEHKKIINFLIPLIIIHINFVLFAVWSIMKQKSICLLTWIMNISIEYCERRTYEWINKNIFMHTASSILVQHSYYILKILLLLRHILFLFGIDVDFWEFNTRHRGDYGANPISIFSSSSLTINLSHFCF